MAEKEERELRKLEKEIKRDQKEIEKMVKELGRYADIFRDASRYLSSLDKAETWRLPDDYPSPREILRKHFPRTANQCCFKGGWGYPENAWNELKADWESHNGYENDPKGREENLKRKEAVKITYQTEFWFNIADFY